MSVKDPYKYFRIEVRELLDGLQAGVRALDRSARGEPAESKGLDSIENTVATLMRHAHTLKGAARVVRQPALADVAHAFEEALEPLRKGERTADAELARTLQAHVDAMETHAAGLAGPPPGNAAPSATAPRLQPIPAEPTTRQPFQVEPLPFETVQLETVRVARADLDAVLEPLGQARMDLLALQRSSVALTEALELARDLADAEDSKTRSQGERLHALLESAKRLCNEHAQAASRDVDEALDGVWRLRLVPVATILPQLERAVADAAEVLGRRVTWRATGGEVRLDAPVLALARDALLHVVRNAVAHGIELPQERTAMGKPAGGSIELAVTRHASHVRVRCQDDGRGLDLQAVRQAAVQTGRWQQAPETLDEAGAIDLLLQGGISTATVLTGVAGRGVGLETVRAAVQQCHGEVHVRSEPGHGLTVELRLPVTVAAVEALLAEVGSVTVALPLDAVVRVERVTHASLAMSDRGPTWVANGRAVPFAPLHALLGQALPVPPAVWSVALITAGQRQIALGLDRLLGTARVTVRPLPESARCSPLVSGAALDADGVPQLVLDPLALIDAMGLRDSRTPWQPQPPPDAPPLLVIDDSLTTRMLEQGILEAAGYRVDTAVSAEQALEMITTQRYGAFIVDVEMPGMDGFGFIARTRADPEQCDIPSILVSSRYAPEDLARGKAAGAVAYIVKGEFDQELLLRTLREHLARRAGQHRTGDR